MATIRWHRSLTAKLFLLMSLAMILTVGAVTFQESQVLRDLLTRQLEDSTVRQTKDLAANLESQLTHWRSIANIGVTRMAGSTTEGYAAFVASFVSSEPGLEGLFLARTANEPTSDPPQVLVSRSRDDGFDGDATKAKAFETHATALVAQLARNAEANKSRSLILADLEPVLGLPLMAVVARFRVQGTDGEIWAVLAVPRPTALANQLGEQGMAAILLDRDFKPMFTSGGLPSELTADLPQIVTGIRATDAAFGYRGYKGKSGKDMLAGFTTLPDFELTVLVTQEAEGARLAIKKTVLQALLWAWLAMMAAVLVSYVAAHRVTRDLKAVTAATQKIAGGDFVADLMITSGDEVAALADSVNSMSHQIRELLDAKVAAARQEKELETARLVQMTLFPKGDVVAPGLLLVGVCHPASECGGDLWGHARIGEHLHYLFIADVTGHGASAALVTAMVFGQWLSLTNGMNEGGSVLSPVQVLERLNQVLYQAGNGATTMTMFVATVDVRNFLLSYASAGHTRPYIIPAAADDPRFEQGFADGGAKGNKRFAHHRLSARGMPLGLFPTAEAEPGQLSLRDGDKFLLYTDGVIECESPASEPWGEKNLRLCIDEIAGCPARDFVEGLSGKAFAHFATQPRNDDVTAVVLEVRSAKLASELVPTGG